MGTQEHDRDRQELIVILPEELMESTDSCRTGGFQAAPADSVVNVAIGGSINSEIIGSGFVFDQGSTSEGTDKPLATAAVKCSVCLGPICPADEQVICSGCGQPYHADCWQENLGCATYGCLQVNALRTGPEIRIGSTMTPMAGGGQAATGQAKQNSALMRQRIESLRHEREQIIERRRTYNLLSIALGLSGLLLFVFGSVTTQGSDAAQLIVSLGSILFISGCCFYAKYRGRSAWLGLLGIASLFGLLAIGLGPDFNRDRLNAVDAQLAAYTDASIAVGKSAADQFRVKVQPQLSSPAVLSLMLCLFPYVGLPMAICAARKISHSNGQLYGKKLALASVVVNAVFATLMIGGLIDYLSETKPLATKPPATANTAAPAALTPTEPGTRDYHPTNQLNNQTNSQPPSTKFFTNSFGMKFAKIPAGEFMMGSPESEKGHEDDERQHRVRITKAFLMGVFPVTQSEYERVMGKNPSWFSITGGGQGKVERMDTASFPVENVLWDEATEFCRRITESEHQTGRVPAQWKYGLPTEAEWEYACRAGTTTAFSFGNSCNGTEANCDGTEPYGERPIGPAVSRPTTVGSYAPNAFGLYDMHGNVWQWCSDWFGNSFDHATDSPLMDDPQGPASGVTRVIRGGSFTRYPVDCRSANRYFEGPTSRESYIGFRVVCQQE